MKLFLLFLLFLNQSFASTSSKMTCLFAKGKVSIFHQNKKNPLVKDFTLSVGDIIETEAGALAILKFPNETVKVNEKSSFQVLEINSKNDLFAVSKGAVIVNKIKKSILDNLNNNEKNVPLIIKTKYASIGVRGTTFFLYQGEKDQTVLSVKEGTVAFKADASEHDVFVKKDNSSMTNEENKNLKAQKFGFEDKINYALDPKEKLESSSDLYSAIEQAWGKYKKDQEALWQKQLDTETDNWSNWKKKNGER